MADLISPHASYSITLGRYDRRLAGITLDVWQPNGYAPPDIAGTGADDDVARYPALFFNPGWRSTSTGSEYLLSALAKAGFIAVAVNRAPALTDRLGTLDFSSTSAFRATLARADSAVRRQSAQMTRIFDLLQQKTPLSRQVDFDRVGILGYSFGGAVAVETALRSTQFKAALNIDGWLFGKAAHAQIALPFMMMSDPSPLPSVATLHAGGPAARYGAQIDRRTIKWLDRQLARPDAYWIEFEGASHEAFLDEPGPVGALRRELKGDRSGTLPDLVKQYAVAFFGQYLENKSSTLLQNVGPGRAMLDGSGHVVSAKPSKTSF